MQEKYAPDQTPEDRAAKKVIWTVATLGLLGYFISNGSHAPSGEPDPVGPSGMRRPHVSAETKRAQAIVAPCSGAANPFTCADKLVDNYLKNTCQHAPDNDACLKAQPFHYDGYHYYVTYTWIGEHGEVLTEMPTWWR